jgi:hypothetical protein
MARAIEVNQDVQPRIAEEAAAFGRGDGCLTANSIKRDPTVNSCKRPGCASPFIGGATSWLQMKNKAPIVDVQGNNKAMAKVSVQMLVARLTA